MIGKLYTGRGIADLVSYITHDKPTGDDRHPETMGRVAHVQSIGLPGVPPEVMTRIMQGVTADQAAIKRRAGSSTRGRKLEQPYGHLVLSWPPGQSPTDEEEISAVREALKAIDVSPDCYGVLSRHRDTDHAHTHVAFSRIDPNTGIAAKLNHSKNRLSRWALQHEEQHGGIVCHKRAQRWKVGENPTIERKVRDAVDRLIVRTPDERREWHETLSRQKREETPRSQARAERADLNRRQTAARLTAEHERADVRAKRCRALAPSKPPRPVSIAPTPERPRLDLARIDIAVPALPEVPRPVSIAPTPERPRLDLARIDIAVPALPGVPRPVSIAPTPERPRLDLARIDIAVPALPGMPRPVSIAPTPERIPVPPPVRTVQDRPQVPVIEKPLAVVRGAGRPAGDPPPTRTTKAPTRTGPGG